MSNLHEITTQGSGISLGPVTVTRAFPKFAGSSSCLVLVSDPSVQAPVAVKVWGPASNTAFAEGMVITFQGQGPKGKLEYKQYKEKWEINANDCNVLVGGAPAAQLAPQAAPQSASGGYQPRSQPTSATSANDKPMTLPPDEMARRMDSIVEHAAEMATRLVDAYVSKGFTKEEAIQMASGGHGLYPTSWFLEKGY